jgi:hypothetical protein
MATQSESPLAVTNRDCEEVRFRKNISRASGPRAGSGPVPQPLYVCFGRPCSQQLRSAVLAPPPLAPVLAVARLAVLALALRAPVLAVARAAVLAHVLPAPVLAAARAAVLAPVLRAPVLALPCHGPWGLFHSLPARTTAIPAVILGAASTAAPVCVLAGATFVLARKGFSPLRLLRG